MRDRFLALSLAGCLLLSGCGRVAPDPAQSAEPSPDAAVETPVPQETRVFTLPADPVGGWNPYVGSQSGNMTLAPLLYESLFELDGTITWHPLLAKSAEASENGLVWTVILREGVTFSGGQTLDAKTAAAAVNAARDKKSVYATRLSGVKSVAAEDEYTLTFTLSAPNARLPALLDFPIALVKGEEVYGTGPYEVGEGKLVARTGWWRGLDLPLQGLELMDISDAAALVTAFNAGSLSLAATDPTGSDSLGYAGTYQSWEYPTSNMLYLGFQCGKGLCKSAEFRRLVSRALDREALTAQALDRHAAAAALPAPASAGLYDAATARALDFDREAVAQALDELGYTLGEDGVRQSRWGRVSLKLVANADNAYKERLAQWIAQALGEMGMEVKVEALPWEEYTKALEKGDFDLYLAECRLTGDLDPTPFLTRGSGLYYGGFYDKELTGALYTARLTGEWEDFYTRWADQAPMAVICFKNAQMLTQWGQVEGADPTQGDLFYHFENWTIR